MIAGETAPWDPPSLGAWPLAAWLALTLAVLLAVVGGLARAARTRPVAVPRIAALLGIAAAILAVGWNLWSPVHHPGGVVCGTGEAAPDLVRVPRVTGADQRYCLVKSRIVVAADSGAGVALFAGAVTLAVRVRARKLRTPAG
ncbi:MAG: hypothetical protein QOJ50_1638 [Cryptosporangiaceae bacterium]|nr:hypothetical protein [Cryptosporangiaceae bacterium]